MRFKVITAMNKKIYERYGHKMIDTFLTYWPSSVDLNIFTEEENSDFLEHIVSNPRIRVYHYKNTSPELFEFINRHKDRPDQQNPEELHLGAVRFAYKTFAIFYGTMHDSYDRVIWLDADVVTHTIIPKSVLVKLSPDEAHVTYLGRKNNYSECGFVIYNVRHLIHEPFMFDWKNLYLQDTLFELPQWHDCVAFDMIREKSERILGIPNVNLSPWGKDYDHVFINSVLGEYMDHLKGPRKQEGRSRMSDLKISRSNIEYWK